MNFSKVKNFMDHLAEAYNPGSAIQIYKKNECVFEYAAGYSDAENKVPMTGREHFNIYSCSKVTTVAAALQLLEAGAFLMDDPLYEYIPEFKDLYVREAQTGDVHKAENTIRVRDLFSMTAGLSYDMEKYVTEDVRKATGGKMDTLTVVKAFAKQPLYFEPGTHWQYSLCHDVLAGLVVAITGKPFREYVKQNIFEPLGMKDSFYHHNEAVLQNLAKQYQFVPYDPAQQTADFVEAQKAGKAKAGKCVDVGPGVSYTFGQEYDSGGAGITTTVADYAKLAAALANYGMGATGERILAPKTIDLMRTNTLSPEVMKDFNWAQMKGYGYGFGVRTLMDKAKAGAIGSLGEFGWGGAAGATILCDPEQNLSYFFAQHTLNPREEYYQPRLRNVVYASLD